MRKIFIDMDGVIVDFDRYMAENNMTAEEVKKTPGAYYRMKPMHEAIDSACLLAGVYDVWIATKPPTGQAHAYQDKAMWVFKHMPEFTKKLIITHDKGLLGDEGDFLIDDRPHKANCYLFKGQLLAFGALHQFKNWYDIREYFSQLQAS